MCIVTETWMKSNHTTIKEELLMGHGIGMISFNRPGTMRGGGVAIAYNTEVAKFEENKFHKFGLEIVSAVGRINGEPRVLVTYGLYLPPNLKKDRADRACELVNENISELKSKFESPVIILGGDFNQFDIKKCFEDHPDISICPSDAT